MAVRRGGLAGFNAQELSNTVWAYATAGVAADALYAAVAEEAEGGRERAATGEMGLAAAGLAVVAMAMVGATV